MTSRHLARYYLIDGDNLERAYKHHLSGYPEWEQLKHAGDWMLLPDNIGENLSIDETSLQDDLFTFLSNKDGHCRQGTIIAAVRGTRSLITVRDWQLLPLRDFVAHRAPTSLLACGGALQSTGD